MSVHLTVAGFGLAILYNFVILCWCHLCKYVSWTLYNFELQFNLTIARDTWLPPAANGHWSALFIRASIWILNSILRLGKQKEMNFVSNSGDALGIFPFLNLQCSAIEFVNAHSIELSVKISRTSVCLCPPTSDRSRNIQISEVRTGWGETGREETV